MCCSLVGRQLLMKTLFLLKSVFIVFSSVPAFIPQIYIRTLRVPSPDLDVMGIQKRMRQFLDFGALDRYESAPLCSQFLSVNPWIYYLTLLTIIVSIYWAHAVRQAGTLQIPSLTYMTVLAGMLLSAFYRWCNWGPSNELRFKMSSYDLSMVYSCSFNLTSLACEMKLDNAIL